MIIFKKAADISAHLDQQIKNGNTIGFAPTMGALHEGHLSLIKKAREENRITVCSIFVNPTQFNNPEDLQHYPVTIEKDIEQLIHAGCDVLFLPPVYEIYPPGFHAKQYDLGSLETVFEGKYRPGHFQGVCQVVDRLLEIVRPNRLYLGQKDFQQCMVISRLIELLGKETKIAVVIVPTMREPDGLAMSSRNLRLSETQRKKAPGIFTELNFIQSHVHEQALSALQEAARAHLEAQGFRVDYIEIVHRQDLSAAKDASAPLVVLAAASIDQIRLIDNMLLN